MKKESMDGLTERRNKHGEPTGLQLRITVGTKDGYGKKLELLQKGDVLHKTQLDLFCLLVIHFTI